MVKFLMLPENEEKGAILGIIGSYLDDYGDLLFLPFLKSCKLQACQGIYISDPVMITRVPVHVDLVHVTNSMAWFPVQTQLRRKTRKKHGAF